MVLSEFRSRHGAHYVNNVMMKLATSEQQASVCVCKGVEEVWRWRAGDDTSSVSSGAVHDIAGFQDLRARTANACLESI